MLAGAIQTEKTTIHTGRKKGTIGGSGSLVSRFSSWKLQLLGHKTGGVVCDIGVEYLENEISPKGHLESAFAAATVLRT